jgi:hypothetical protein
MIEVSPLGLRWDCLQPTQSRECAVRFYVKLGMAHVGTGISAGQMASPGPERRPQPPTGGLNGRRCQDCGTLLAADNTARLCSKCHREHHDQLRTPAHLKNEFFETAEFRVAFDSQHMGKVLKAYRNHPHHLRLYGKALNQELLGRWLGLTQAQISKFENGKAEQNLEILRAYAKILHLPQRMLWFDFPGQSRLRSQVSIETGGIDMKQVDESRRSMDAAIAAGSVTSAQLDNIDEMVDLHARDCVTASPADMLRRLTLDFGDIRSLISRPQSLSAATRLYSNVARIAALVADELMVIGDTHRAWAWHRSAAVAASEVGSTQLRLLVHSLGILIPLYYGDPDSALRMATQASELGDSHNSESSSAHSLAVTLKALIQAQAGLTSEAEKTLGHSGELFARLSSKDKPTQLSASPNVVGGFIAHVHFRK